MYTLVRTASLVLALSLTSACASSQAHENHHAMAENCPWTSVHDAVAVIRGTAGHPVRGTVTFTDVPGAGVRVVVDVEGLTPGGTHAIHVHEFGDVRDEKTALSAGGHYNPEGHAHAMPDVAERHAGDFGNLVADSAGRCRREFTVENLTVAGAHNPVVGRSLVIHVAPDDGRTQPTGNAGARMAVGVVGVAKPDAAN